MIEQQNVNPPDASCQRQVGETLSLDDRHPAATYDQFAWFYNRYWGPDFCQTALPIYRQILFPLLPPEAEILDLCCGTGQIAAALLDHGYRVTGLDGSREMLAFAAKNAPRAQWLCADARTFSTDRAYDLVLSSFDSLNHLMSLEELAASFGCVSAALRPGGLFLFDLNLEDENEALGGSFDLVEEDHVCLVRTTYQPLSRLKRYQVTLFERSPDLTWYRTDLTLEQRYHDTSEVAKRLSDAGFLEIQLFDARVDFGRGQRDSRMYYLARKAATTDPRGGLSPSSPENDPMIPAL
jgi:SAM-dependent methyltransferase